MFTDKIVEVVKNRRSLTPPMGLPALEDDARVRRTDIRREVSERIQLRGLASPGASSGAEARVLKGWALNVSRGGVRCILAEKVELGDEFELTVGEENKSPLTRRARIVWVQEENDGVIVGLEFSTSSGLYRSPASGPDVNDPGSVDPVDASSPSDSSGASKPGAGSSSPPE